MSTDQQTEMVKIGEHIRTKIDQRNACRKEVDTLVKHLESLLSHYKSDRRNTEEIAAHLTRLPQDDVIVRTFRKLLDAERALTCIQQRLGLDIKQAD